MARIRKVTFPLPSRAQLRRCVRCSHRDAPTWDVYLLNLHDGSTLPVRTNVPPHEAARFMHWEQGDEDCVMVLWPHAASLFPKHQNDVG